MPLPVTANESCNAHAKSPPLRQAGFSRPYNGLDPAGRILKSENTAC